MNQKESSDGCGGILIGAIVGVFAGYFVYGVVAEVVGPTGPTEEIYSSGFAAIITWCICVWVAGNIADGTFASKFRQSKTINPEVVGLPSLSKKSQQGANTTKKDTPENLLDIECNKCHCKGHIRLWENQYRCWKCGYVMRDENTTQPPEPIQDIEQTMEPSQSIIGDERGKKLLYTRNDGNYGVIFFDPTSVRFSENQVILRPQGTDEQFSLLQDKILNPEILSQSAEVPIMPTATKEAPVLEPTDFIVGDMAGTELLYTRSDGRQGVIYFDPDSLELTDIRAVVSPYGTNEKYAILLEKILNPEVLNLEKTGSAGNDIYPEKQPIVPEIEGEPPPILEPDQFIVGDSTGRELIYTRSNGERGVIYFDPDSLELTNTRAIVSPYGTDEEYAILLEKILNPEALSSQPQVPVIPQPEPLPVAEPVTPAPRVHHPVAIQQFETGVRVIIEELPADTYEAAQIMRSLKPKLGPFELLEALKFEHETLLQGYDEVIAKDIGKDLEMAGCTVSLQSVDESGVASAVMEPKAEVLIDPDPQVARQPTKDMF